MANRMKEDEKNERIIRGLLKLPENKKCINCNSLGPQYVCTNFCTFICTTCSGIHREFTHRVKSVSMAKFSLHEVTALQEGGNKRAKEIYFKELDPQLHSFPSNSNIDRLRDFIKHVYVDRRYSGGRSSDNPPKGRMDGKEDFYETRTDSYQGGSRSPPYEKKYDRPYSGKSSPGGRSSDERRSPGFDQESPQYSNYKSSAHTEVVNDWQRENRLEGRSPQRSKDLDPSSPPIVRPVREILGENVIPLRIEPPGSNGSRKAAVSDRQRTASSSSLGTVEVTKLETKVEFSGSLIDFDDVPEPPVSSVPQPYQIIATQTGPQPVSSSNNDWASFDTVPEVKFSQGGSGKNKLESVLSELSGSTSVPGQKHISPLADGVPNSGLISTVPVSSVNSFIEGAGTPLWPTMQIQQTSLFPSTVVQSMTQQYMPIVDGNHAWNVSHPVYSQGPASYSAAQQPQAVTQSIQDVTSAVVSQPSAVEVKSSARKELPADIFAATYSSYPAPVPGWHAGPTHAMNFNMQYNTVVHMQQVTHSAKSSNPFDQPPQVQSSSFPSMASLQGSLPAGQPTMGLMRSASVDTPSSVWTSGQPPFYPASLPSQQSYPSSLPPNNSFFNDSGMYVGQQLPNNTQPRPPGVGNFGTERAAYLNMDHQMVGRFSAPPSPHPASSASRNPFE